MKAGNYFASLGSLSVSFLNVPPSNCECREVFLCLCQVEGRMLKRRKGKDGKGMETKSDLLRDVLFLLFLFPLSFSLSTTCDKLVILNPKVWFKKVFKKSRSVILLQTRPPPPFVPSSSLELSFKLIPHIILSKKKKSILVPKAKPAYCV